MKIAVVVQARLGSSRLPGKILKPVCDRSILVAQLERIRAIATDVELVVATTTDPGDAAVVEEAERHGYRCFRGHPTDLLDRHYRAAAPLKPDAVVKIPSDCPLIDPGVIDRVLGFYRERSDVFDFVSNLHPATYPDGNDVEVMPWSVLETAWHEAKKPHEREHTTPFIWDQPKRFRIGNVSWETGLDLSMSHRFTIDYEEDYRFIKAVYEALWSPSGPPFSMQDILQLLEDRPDIMAINSKYAGVNWYRHHLNDLSTVSNDDTRQPEA